MPVEGSYSVVCYQCGRKVADYSFTGPGPHPVDLTCYSCGISERAEFTLVTLEDGAAYYRVTPCP